MPSDWITPRAADRWRDRDGSLVGSVHLSQDASNRADRLGGRARLTAALRLELLRLEAQRAAKKAPELRDATDLAAMGYSVIYGPGSSDRERMNVAGQQLANAVRLEPDLLALTARTDWLLYEIEVLPPERTAPLKARSTRYSPSAP